MRKSSWMIALLFAAMVPGARADSLEQFTLTGTFLNSPGDALSGGFVVDESTGQLASVDLFHGATELNILGSTGVYSGLPDAFYLNAVDAVGDRVGLVLVAPGNGGSLAGYTGGAICDSSASNPACESLPIGIGSFVGSAFYSHLGTSYDFVDDLYTGSVTDSGPATPPAPTPEPATGALTLLGIGLVVVKRRRIVWGLPTAT